MNVPIKTRVLNEVVSRLQPLRQEHGFQVIKRVLNPYLNEPTLPAIHVYGGHTTRQQDDAQGFYVDLPIVLNVFFADGARPAEKGDEIEAWIHEKMETDLQLTGWVLRFNWEETRPFVSEITKPRSGLEMIFAALYRRRRGDVYNPY